MSSLWTPDGERPIRRETAAAPEPPSSGPAGGPNGGSGEEPDEETMRAEMAQMQEELASTPVEAVIANHAVGLFNLAGLHLSRQPPNLEQARLAIDAFGALVEGLSGRLGPDEAALVDGLAQLRLAFVQIRGAQQVSGSDPG
jgi:hypothetical protein